MQGAAPARLESTHDYIYWWLFPLVVILILSCLWTCARRRSWFPKMPDASAQPKERRRQAPKHITLPDTPYMDSDSVIHFSHIFPQTPGTRSSLGSANEQRAGNNPFFILNEETPPIPVHRLNSNRSTPTSPNYRRPRLSAELSLEHAFGDMRAANRPHDPPDLAAQDQHPPQKQIRAKDLSIPSPIFSCRSSVVSESRSEPKSSPTKSKKSRPRSRTVLSDGGTRWSLETPSFRSTACATPTGMTPRQISISEVPLLEGELGYAVDIFGLAALQPPRIHIRPRPRMRPRDSITPVSATPSDEASDNKLVERGVYGPGDLLVPARTASPARG